MPAYVLAMVEILQPERYPEYAPMAARAVEAFGGRYIARGGRQEALEGEWSPKRIAMIEFENMEKAKAWWNSEQYREAKALRQAIARTTLLVVEGLENKPASEK
jgi:uncharacterized protein (DUF1330 family)